MAELRNRDEIYGLSNRISLTLTHFAKGAYPVFSATPQALSVNRMLGIFENPNGAENFIRCGDDKLPLIPGTVCFIPAYLPAQVRLDDRALFVSIQFSLELHSGVELFSMYKHIRSEYRPELVARLVEIFDSDRSCCLRSNCASTCSHSYMTCSTEVRRHRPTSRPALRRTPPYSTISRPAARPECASRSWRKSPDAARNLHAKIHRRHRNHAETFSRPAAAAPRLGAAAPSAYHRTRSRRRARIQQRIRLFTFLQETERTLSRPLPAAVPALNGSATSRDPGTGPDITPLPPHRGSGRFSGCRAPIRIRCAS